MPTRRKGRRRKHTTPTRKRTNKTRTVFYGYPSNPVSNAETIARALKIIRQSQPVKSQALKIEPWPEIPNSGNNLLGQITKAISRSQVAAFDVTHPNPNVAFEIGFALAQSKRIWLSLDSTVAQSRANFRTHYTRMLDALYREYENHEHLAARFLADTPWTDSGDQLLPIPPIATHPKTESYPLLYLTPPIETTAVLDVTNFLSQSELSPNIIVDNAREHGRPSLEWYTQNIRDAEAVLIHIMSDDHINADLYNARASLIAGLAHGTDTQLLMVAHSPYYCPTDYHSLLQQHQTAKECLDIVADWYSHLDFKFRRPRRPTRDGPKLPGEIRLRDLSLGEAVAENERWKLDDYFVETDWFYQAEEPELSLMIGRRGSGKTATLYALEDKYHSITNVHVCSVQPEGYELGGVISLLEETKEVAVRGYLIESLWKFLLYTELAISVVRDIETRPAHLQRTQEETDLLAYVLPFKNVMLAPFSQRLNEAVVALAGIGNSQEVTTQRARVSEHLHKTYIGELVRHLRSVLAGKEKVLILVDKLDDRWGMGPNHEAQSTLLAGLIDVTRDVMMDLCSKRADISQVNLSFVVFIRSDIFNNLRIVAGELDKLPITRMSWSDGQELLTILDHRLVHIGTKELDPSEVWNKLFVEQVEGLTPRDYVLTRTLPRPRDILVFAKNAVSAALKRSHDVVDAEDFEFAYQQYSGHAFDAAVFEDDPERGMLRAVLAQHAGCFEILKESEVRRRIRDAGVRDRDLVFYLELLCDLNVLGIRGPSGFRYAADESERSRLLDIGRSFASNSSFDELEFRVHPAFCPALGVDKIAR